MPRLKPPPAKTELPDPQDNTPIVGDVQIDLSAPPSGEAEIDLAAPPKPVPVVVAPKEQEEDQPLQKALEAQKRAEELQATAQRERDEAIRRTGERERELAAERTEREEAQYNSVLTAISAEQATISKAEADYAGYASVGDWTNAAAAQRILASASARLDRLEDGKQSFETKREVEKTKPPERQAPQPRGFEEQIAALPDKAKTWLRKHPEFINDTSMNNKIGATHAYLTANKGVEPFSDAYFDALDTEFGFKAAAEPSPPTAQRRSMPVSAPVSRDVPSPSGQRTESAKITLTEEERRIARTSFSAPDMTDAQKEYQYAKNKQKLAQMRANGSYPQPERG